MTIAGLQKLTLLDFPGKLACTVFLSACNFRCPFCYNAPLVFNEPEACQNLSEEEFFSFLKSRQGILEGVCITGGEPLMRDLTDFIKAIRALGFLVKLDTNGAYPARLKALMDAALVDYVAMDVKNEFPRYGQTVGLSDFDESAVKKSMRLLREGNVEFEFRTTVCRELHPADALLRLAQEIGDVPRWFLQNYNEEGCHIGAKLTPYNKEDLEALLPRLSLFVPSVSLRGI